MVPGCATVVPLVSCYISLLEGQSNVCVMRPLSTIAHFEMGYGFLSYIAHTIVRATLCTFVILIIRHVWAKRKRCLPPGPPGLPLLGNVYDISQDAPWVSYRDLAAQYGEP